jgi:spore germination protein KA
MLTSSKLDVEQNDEIKWAAILKNEVIGVKNISESDQFSTMIKELLLGKTIILLDGFSSSLAADTTKWKERALGPSQLERNVKGPIAGFTELKSTNIALLRSMVKNPSLRVQSKVYGTSTKTDVSIVYLEDKVDHQILNELLSRLDQVNLESLFETNYIDEILTKESKSIFPIILSTDRPDTIAANIVEGRIAIIVDGAPSVLLLPVVFWQFFQTSDDYYVNTKLASQRRVLRIVSFLLAIYIPALYVAFTSYHPGFLPSTLLFSFIAQREATPMPVVVEVVVFLILIVILLESAVRLQQTLVLSVSIFGAIALGQAAIESQFVTPATLVVLSAAFILQGMIPNFTLSGNVLLPLRMMLLLLSELLGMYGIMVGSLFLLLHLCSLRSFGVPYLSLIAPFNPNDQKDTLVRGPIDEIDRENKQNKMRKEEYMKETTQ